MSQMGELDKRHLLGTLKRLKERYEEHLRGTRTREALTRSTLIDPLLGALGWDVSDPTQCIVEDWVQKSGSPNWADYSLLNADGTTCIVWEAKRADHNFAFRNLEHPEGVWADASTREFVEQGLDYAYRKGADWAVLTNGHQMVLLESFRSGKEHLRPDQAKLLFNSFNEMLERSDELWLLNRASVLGGRLDARFDLEPRQFVVTKPLPVERTAPDIYAERSDWMSVPLADLSDPGSVLLTDRSEEIYANLLPVKRLPQSIYSAPSECRSRGDVLRVAGGQDYIPCILRGGRLWTFAQLRDALYVDRGACGSDVEQVATSEWERDSDKRRWLVQLLHDCLHEHARIRGLDRGRLHRYYFRPFGDTVFRRVQYRSFSRGASRWVVRQDRTTGYWIHLAATLKFITMGNRFLLLVDPTFKITKDGTEWVDGSVAGPMVTSLLSGRRNRSYLYDMNFWKAWLAVEIDNHRDQISLACGDARVQVSTRFVSGKAPFSIPSFADEQEDLDEGVLDG